MFLLSVQSKSVFIFLKKFYQLWTLAVCGAGGTDVDADDEDDVVEFDDVFPLVSFKQTWLLCVTKQFLKNTFIN